MQYTRKKIPFGNTLTFEDLERVEEIVNLHLTKTVEEEEAEFEELDKWFEEISKPIEYQTILKREIAATVVAFMKLYPDTKRADFEKSLDVWLYGVWNTDKYKTEADKKQAVLECLKEALS